MNKEIIHTGLIALGAFALAYMFQKNIMQVPVLGAYLPGGTTTTTTTA